MKNAEIELLNEQLTNHGHAENNNILNNGSNDFNTLRENVTGSVNGNNK